MNQEVVFNGTALSPTALLSDTDQYDGANPSTAISLGLAEYTNANFFSDDTIFTEARDPDDPHAFPYPAKAATNIQAYIDKDMLPATIVARDGIEDTGFWIAKTDGQEPIDHFVKPTYFTYDTSPDTHADLYFRLFYLDEQCHRDYAEKLIPRAVGYSAALIDYFFRGTIAIAPPQEGIYAIIDGGMDDQRFEVVKARLHNTTPDEKMLEGTLVAVARYTRRIDYVPDLSANEPPTADSREEAFTYSVSAPIDIASLTGDAGSAQPFAFDFSADPIPAGITDLFLQVIFKGTLGGEIGTAVAVGAADLFEPTHIDAWNLTDRFYMQGRLTTAEELRADPGLVDDLNDDCPHVAAFLDPFPMDIRIGFSASPLQPPVYLAEFTALAPGRYGRLVVLVPRPDATMHLRRSWPALGFEQTTRSIVAGATNQEEDDGFVNTAVYRFRGTTTHRYSGYLFYCPDLAGLLAEDFPAAADAEPAPAMIAF
ncbi:MAG TPA: hypothetical protein VLT88_00790 [Desulfosarcina sp.]|nr:hypothetical protein [Desulfosarcina sp.]